MSFEGAIAIPVMAAAGTVATVATALYGARSAKLKMLYSLGGFYGLRGLKECGNISINLIDGMTIDEGLLNYDNKKLREQYNPNYVLNGPYTGQVVPLKHIFEQASKVDLLQSIVWEVPDEYLAPMLRNHQRSLEYFSDITSDMGESIVEQVDEKISNHESGVKKLTDDERKSLISLKEEGADYAKHGNTVASYPNYELVTAIKSAQLGADFCQVFLAMRFAGALVGDVPLHLLSRAFGKKAVEKGASKVVLLLVP